jgi:hypothetical protein
MNKGEILNAFIRSGRLSIIPLGFTGEEREGEVIREGEGEGEGAKCDECGCEHDKENDLMTIKGEVK